MHGLSQETLRRSGTQKLTNDEKSLLFQAIEENPRIKHSESLALVNYKVSRQNISRLFQSANHHIGYFFKFEIMMKIKGNESFGLMSQQLIEVKVFEH